MDVRLLWAGIRFSARNGGTDALLSEAARTGLHLSEIVPAPGGFTARCAAWQYRKLARLARRRRVRLRITKRTGVYFFLRPVLRRHGLWTGVLLFVPLLLWSQNLVWAMDASTLSTGQRARAFAVLREQTRLIPGSFVTQEKLISGEYALLQSGEFSWASLNFLDGRLVVEAAAAKPVPEIAAGHPTSICARTAGTVVRTELRSGTMLVAPGQTVEAGQELIGTSRTERDGTLIFAPAAGSVLGRFDWETTQDEPLSRTVQHLTGATSVKRQFSVNGQNLAIPAWKPFSEEQALSITRHVQPELFGLCLPFSIEETTYYEQTEQTFHYSEAQALALAQMHSLQALFDTWPDAELIAQKEDHFLEHDRLHYRVVYTIQAELGAEP